MQLAHRSLACFAFIVAFAVGLADEYDDAIASLKRHSDTNAVAILRNGPAIVDSKILGLFDQLGQGFGMLPHESIQDLLEILAERYHNRATLPSSNFHQAVESITIVLRLKAKYPVSAGRYFDGRGPEFYALLVALANGDDAALAESAAGVLRSTAISSRYLKEPGKPGDPALIRIFRRMKDWSILGVLRDRESIPSMRKVALSRDRKEAETAMIGLSEVPDYDGAAYCIGHLADPEEVSAGGTDGKFGTAYWCLRRGIRPQYVRLLAHFAKQHKDLPRAFAINLIGYFGKPSDINRLKSYHTDPHTRVRAAVQNATLRLQGKLPDLHDSQRWDRPSRKTRSRG